MSTTSARSIEIPEQLALFASRFLSVARHGQGRGEHQFGPDRRRHTSFTAVQDQYVCDVLQCLHNLAEPEGVAFFYEQAAKLNAAWRPHQQALLVHDHDWFAKLYPLPEAPR